VGSERGGHTIMKSTRLEVFFYIEPDVPAYLVDSDELALEFEDWSGDEIIASSPHYFASDRIVELILDNAFTGFSSSEINTRLTEKFSVLSTFVSVPGFSLLNIEGSVDEIPRSLPRQQNLWVRIGSGKSPSW
jgi:hypothetical protein